MTGATGQLTRDDWMQCIWDIGTARFERWEKLLGPTQTPTTGGATALAALGFRLALQELSDTELERAVRMLAVHTFAQQRSGWFVPTPIDLIDMVRGVPAPSHAILQWRRGAEGFLDSAYGQRMRIALIERHWADVSSVPSLAAHVSVLDERDDWQLNRAYELALLWTRNSASIDHVAKLQLESIPSVATLKAWAAQRKSASLPGLFTSEQRHPATPAGIELAAALAKRVGVVERGTKMSSEGVSVRSDTPKNAL